jgi:hypothetical protein
MKHDEFIGHVQHRAQLLAEYDRLFELGSKGHMSVVE